MDKYLTKEEATDFFAEMYFGAHHIPGKVKEHGSGFCIEHHGGMATFDFDQLTRFVVLCHDKCYRGEIKASSPRFIKVCIWARDNRDGPMWQRHPTIEQAVEIQRKK